MMAFFDQNNIISPMHHGGSKGHGTISALSLILNFLQIQKEKNMITTTLLTDLSAAYDTIDHHILFKKLNYYGIRGVPLKIITNILSNRRQFVEIDTYTSNLKPSLPCSVCQGSKLSSYFYIAYTNEIPLLFKIMSDDIYDNITNFKYIDF